MPINFRPPASGIILLGAVVFGALAVFAASRYITQTVQREKERLLPNVETTDVVVAKADLKRGEIVGTDNMAVRKVPRDFVPGTAVDPGSFANVEGARLAVDMRRGEILIRGTLEGADSSTFSTRVPTGVRAITLRSMRSTRCRVCCSPTIASTCFSPLNRSGGLEVRIPPTRRGC